DLETTLIQRHRGSQPADSPADDGDPFASPRVRLCHELHCRATDAPPAPCLLHPLRLAIDEIIPDRDVPPAARIGVGDRGHFLRVLRSGKRALRRRIPDPVEMT